VTAKLLKARGQIVKRHYKNRFTTRTIKNYKLTFYKLALVKTKKLENGTNLKVAIIIIIIIIVMNIENVA